MTILNTLRFISTLLWQKFVSYFPHNLLFCNYHILTLVLSPELDRIKQTLIQIQTAIELLEGVITSTLLKCCFYFFQLKSLIHCFSVWLNYPYLISQNHQGLRKHRLHDFIPNKQSQSFSLPPLFFCFPHLHLLQTHWNNNV